MDKKPIDLLVEVAGVPDITKTPQRLRCIGCGTPSVLREVLLVASFDQAGILKGLSRMKDPGEDIMRCTRCNAAPAPVKSHVNTRQLTALTMKVRPAPAQKGVDPSFEVVEECSGFGLRVVVKGLATKEIAEAVLAALKPLQ